MASSVAACLGGVGRLVFRQSNLVGRFFFGGGNINLNRDQALDGLQLKKTSRLLEGAMTLKLGFHGFKLGLVWG